jgi:hypothetical protein
MFPSFWFFCLLLASLLGLLYSVLSAVGPFLLGTGYLVVV